MEFETDAKLVMIYVNSTDQWHGAPLYSAIVQMCKDRGIAGATVFRGAEGYGSRGQIHTTRLVELSENLPVRVDVVDIAERIEPLLAALAPMIREGLVAVSDVRVRRFLPDPKV